MGRAIVRNPKVFLFDEPLSNLDAKLRVQMRTEIKKVHQKVTTTTVYVTHDQVEAMTLADRVVVMNGGRIEQIGTAQRGLSQPEDPVRRRVYRLAGDEFHAGTRGQRRQQPQRPPLGQADPAGPGLAHRPLQILCRQGGGLRIAPGGHHRNPQRAAARARPAFDVQLDVVEPMGMETMVYFVVDGVEVCGRVNPTAAGNAGESMQLVADMNHMHLIDPVTDQVI